MLDLSGYPQIMTVTHLKEILPVSDDTIYRMAKEPGFPSVKIGTKILIGKNDFAEWWETYKGKEFVLKNS